MELKRNSFSRLFAKMEKIKKLHSKYIDSSGKIDMLKTRRKALKERLKQMHGAKHSLKEAANLDEWDQKLMKADKKITIEQDIMKLERPNDRKFEMREKLKAGAQKRVELNVNGEMPVVIMNRVDDITAAAKIVELMRVNPTCKIEESVEVGSSTIIKDTALKLNVKIEDVDGPERIDIGPTKFDEKSEIVKSSMVEVMEP